MGTGVSEEPDLSLPYFFSVWLNSTLKMEAAGSTETLLTT
jgi:hypothetical protein